MIRNFSLAKGIFSTKISLAKGIRSKTGVAHPRQFFVGVPPGSPPPPPNLLKQVNKWKQKYYTKK